MSKVLLVEDDLELAKSLCSWLECESHTVEHVTAGADANQLLENFSFDVIVLDWMLPDISGYKVLETFRARGGITPVIFLTGRRDIESKTSGLDCGADDYLVKPFDSRELCARIRSILRRPIERKAGNTLQMGQLSLHPDTGQSFVAGQTVHLTGKEYAVLAFLMQHQNQSFSARMILKNVWEEDSPGSEDAVRKLMSRLRQKLSSFGMENALRTEAGSGYILGLAAEPKA